MNFSNQENGENLAFSQTFLNFYPMLDYYKTRTSTNFENPNGKSFRSTSNNVI